MFRCFLIFGFSPPPIGASVPSVVVGAGGLAEGTEVILYPSDTLADGTRVEKRAEGE